MICNKCNHKLPDDSEFCQYCGNKIEAEFDNITSDEALKSIMKIQSQETVRAMKANSQAQPDNEVGEDFGLVPEKPIYTLALQSVDGEREYLSKLRTTNGEKVKWNRRGSTSVEGIHGMIDIYDIYLLSGQKYSTIYINMYGAKKSAKAPRGFVFETLETTTNSMKTSNPNTIRKNPPKDKLISFTNISSIALTVISMVSIVVAMNIQDLKRNARENWNTTAVYVILLFILGIFLVFAINSFIKRRFRLLSCLSIIPAIATIITCSEGSILAGVYCMTVSSGYSNVSTYRSYINQDIVDILNIIWIWCVVLVLIIALIPVVREVVKKIINNWHQSVSYREKCYKRVGKIHNYLEKGIITQEEYEKTKSDILKNIQ